MNRRHFIQSLAAGTVAAAVPAAIKYGPKDGMRVMDAFKTVDPTTAAYYINLRTGTLVCHSDYGPSAVRYIDTGEWDREIPENVMAVWFPPQMSEVERWCSEPSPSFESGPLTEMANRMRYPGYLTEKDRAEIKSTYQCVSLYGRRHIFTAHGAR